jgi:hypothetical protein
MACATAAIAGRSGQDEEWGGADPAYMDRCHPSAGARTSHMATEPDLLDPRRAVPSPALA